MPLKKPKGDPRKILLKVDFNCPAVIQSHNTKICELLAFDDVKKNLIEEIIQGDVPQS